VTPSFERTATGGPAAGEEHEPPVIRDKRRVDPVTGLRRESVDAGAATPGPGSADRESGSGDADTVSDLERRLRERTEDLQRLQAEYVNYKKRVDRDREATREAVIGSVLAQLLGVLDDIGRAREHDELVGAFRAVAESLERTVTGLGLEPYGKEGETFDPYLHEALTHTYSDDVSEPTCIHVMQVGYRIGDRILRPARVAVAEPSQLPAATEVDSAEASETDATSPADAAGSSDRSDPTAGAGGVEDSPDGSERSRDAGTDRTETETG
jgi:molecular chaperone GrpE